MLFWLPLDLIFKTQQTWGFLWASWGYIAFSPKAVLLSFHQNISLLLSTYRLLDSLHFELLHIGRQTQQSPFLLLAWVAGKGDLSIFWQMRNRRMGIIGSGGRPSWVRFLSSDLIVFIQIGPCHLDTLLAVDLMLEMGLYLLYFHVSSDWMHDQNMARSPWCIGAPHLLKA